MYKAEGILSTMSKEFTEDPQASREADKYENPIPSREFILQILSENTRLLTHKQLASVLGLIDEEQREALRRRLKAMVRDGQLVVNRKHRYGPAARLDLVAGRVVGHPDGFGFVIPDAGGKDLFLSPKEMRGVLNGDRVLCHVKATDRRGRLEGGIVEVLKRHNQRLVGQLVCEKGIAFVSPDDRRISQDILVPQDNLGNARNGQIVLVDIVEQPSARTRPIGRIADVLGESMQPGMEIDVAIHKYALPVQWPQPVIDQIAEIPGSVSDAERANRRDLRDLYLVTIDGADARDFDDAVYCESVDDGWRLVVAIADVSHYVSVDSALDREAENRATSVYFPNRVIPMLPEGLSNDLCSLKPKVDRLCMVCDMVIDQSGGIREYKFYDAVMHSKARLTYDIVAAILDGDTDLTTEYAEVLGNLFSLYGVFQAFRNARFARGTIELETDEAQFVFDDQLKIEQILIRERNDAHKIIEECMIAANRCAADFLHCHKIPALYRVHDEPDSEKVEQLRAYLGEMGLVLKGGESPSPTDYADLMVAAQDSPGHHLIQTLVLRSLKQAIYTNKLSGHFGLALDRYAHFTSPIRRYPDLLVHRAIRWVLMQKDVSNYSYSDIEMENLGSHCSELERRADEATRDVEVWLKCEYMLDKVGDTFVGNIAGVNSFGFFVELQEIFVSGLVHVTSLKNDYYHHDPTRHSLIGERTGAKFRLGDEVSVRVMRVDLADKKIDLELA